MHCDQSSGPGPRRPSRPRPAHAHISTTQQIYTHVDEAARLDAVTRLNELLSDARGDYRESLVRLAALLVRDHTAAEGVVRDVLEGSPLEGRDAAADRRAVVNRCRGILHERRHPDG